MTRPWSKNGTRHYSGDGNYWPTRRVGTRDVPHRYGVLQVSGYYDVSVGYQGYSTQYLVVDLHVCSTVVDAFNAKARPGEHKARKKRQAACHRADELNREELTDA